MGKVKTQGDDISTHYLTQRQTRIGVNVAISDIISTHYLTQRQTKMVVLPYQEHIISTHYLTQRQTGLSLYFTVPKRFQLTTSRRGRHQKFQGATQWMTISTHYLTQRQTDKHEPDSSASDISTHYLTQRQTGLIHYLRRQVNISTHYLTQRQTIFRWIAPAFRLFQLTTSRRGRRSSRLSK